MNVKQSFFEGLDPREYKKPFGGELLKSNPKCQRPLSFKQSMHLVLRSSKATGKYSFLHISRVRQIKALVQKQASVSEVKILRYANAGNHLHLLVQPSNRIGYRKFIRAITGLIARTVLKTERGIGLRGQDRLKNTNKFWDKRPFTRIVAWGREFTRVSRYLIQNILEAEGLIPYRPRKKSKLSELRV